MVFERGRCFDTKYKTPFGEMDMSVLATTVDCRPAVEKGEIHLAYQLTVSGFPSNREMHIVWHSAKPLC